MTVKAVAKDTIRAVIESFPNSDSINVIVNKIQGWDSLDSLVSAVKEIPSWTQTIAQCLTAIGTIGAVYAAILWPQRQKKKNAPKMEFSFEQSPKYVKIYDSDREGEKKIEIFIGIKNNGRSLPSYPVTYVESYYSLTDSNEKICHKLDENIQLMDRKNSPRIEYIPNGEVLFKVATIKKHVARQNQSAPVELVQNQSVANPAENNADESVEYRVYLCGGGEEGLGQGTFIVPIHFCSVESKEKTYLKIHWNHRDWNTAPERFIIQKNSDDEFNSISDMAR